MCLVLHFGTFVPFSGLIWYYYLTSTRQGHQPEPVPLSGDLKKEEHGILTRQKSNLLQVRVEDRAYE